MFVKICANTNVEDVRLAAALGVDAVGFVFAPSKRRVTAEQVERMVQGLPPGLERVGVFDSKEPGEITSDVRRIGLTAAQLHGSFDVGLVRALDAEFGDALKIIQTVAYAVDAVDAAEQVDAEERFGLRLKSVFDEPAVWAVLIDAAKAGSSGGLGVALDWARVAKLVGRATVGRSSRPRVILAGGLRAENVAQAIAEFQPWGVDVASGVEAVAGKKDPERLRAFVAAVRGAEAERGDSERG
ncbi:MAG: phosphoribosylanthranilate isomerase [Acidobacteriaceae bacterium]